MPVIAELRSGFEQLQKGIGLKLQKYLSKKEVGQSGVMVMY